MCLASVFPGEDTGVPLNGPQNSVLFHSSTSMYVIGSIVVLLGDIRTTLDEASLHRRRTNQQLSKPTTRPNNEIALCCHKDNPLNLIQQHPPTTSFLTSARLLRRYKNTGWSACPLIFSHLSCKFSFPLDCVRNGRLRDIPRNLTSTVKLILIPGFSISKI